MTSVDTLFEYLELEPGSSLANLRRAYTDLVQVWHPDRFQHNPRLARRAEERLKTINTAYEALLTYLETGEAPDSPLSGCPGRSRRRKGSPSGKRSLEHFRGLALCSFVFSVVNDSDEYVRTLAAMILDSMGTASGLEALLDVVSSDESETVRAASARALRQLDTPASADALCSAAACDCSSAVRWNAVASLGHLDYRCSRSTALAALADDDADVRWAAVESLGLLRETQAVPALVRCLSDDDEVADAAADVLAGMPTAATDILAAIDDPQDLSTRKRMLRVLARIGDETHLHAVLPFLEHPAPPVRSAAGAYITSLCTSSTAAIEILVGKMSALPASVRTRVVQSASEAAQELVTAAFWDTLSRAFGLDTEPFNRDPLDALRAFFEATASTDPSVRVRAAALSGIATSEHSDGAWIVTQLLSSSTSKTLQVAAIEAVDELSIAAALGQLRCLLRTTEGNLRSCIIRALGSIGSAVAVRELEGLLTTATEETELTETIQALVPHINNRIAALLCERLTSDGRPSVRAKAAKALSSERRPGVSAALQEALAHDDSQRVRQAALEALASIDTAGALRAVAKAVSDDPSRDIRHHAARALAECSNRAAVPHLLRGLGDHDEAIRITCALGLEGRTLNVHTLKHLALLLGQEETGEMALALVKAIASSTSDEAVTALLPQILSADPRIREIACQQACDRDVAVDLVPLRPELFDHDEQVRIRSADALGRLGDAYALPHLLLLLNDSEQEEDVLHAVIAAIERINPRSVVPGAVALLIRDTDWFDHVQPALVSAAKRGELEVFLGLMDHEHPTVRAAAAWALLHCGVFSGPLISRQQASS